MLTRAILRTRPTTSKNAITAKYGVIQSRQISVLEPLASGIIETGHILSSFPLSASLPPYSSAIIGITLALRTGITLPMALWVSPNIVLSFLRSFVSRAGRGHIVGSTLWALNSRPGARKRRSRWEKRLHATVSPLKNIGKKWAVW